MRPPKIHCATFTQQFVDEPDDGQFKWFRHVGNGRKRREPECGLTWYSSDPDDKTKLELVVIGPVFQLLPRQAQCGNYRRFFSSFGIAGLEPGLVRGQTSATAEQITAVEYGLVMLSRIRWDDPSPLSNAARAWEK